ncbi:MAG: hypothetical protein H7X84_12285 [Verrucomicrobia bacterium]|nr:hypothetical protein [Prolixibacteraceae bacterium]
MMIQKSKKIAGNLLIEQKYRRIRIFNYQGIAAQKDKKDTDEKHKKQVLFKKNTFIFIILLN